MTRRRDMRRALLDWMSAIGLVVYIAAVAALAAAVASQCPAPKMIVPGG